MRIDPEKTTLAIMASDHRLDATPTHQPGVAQCWMGLVKLAPTQLIDHHINRLARQD
jgi:hypothetical protein